MKISSTEARALILAGTALPEGLQVQGGLDLSGCTGLTALPEGLQVQGGLDLSGCTGLTALPEGLQVQGGLVYSAPAPWLATAPAGLCCKPSVDDRAYWSEVLGIELAGCYGEIQRELKRRRARLLALPLEAWQLRAVELFLDSPV